LDAEGKAKMTEAGKGFEVAAVTLKEMKRVEENVIIDNVKFVNCMTKVLLRK
jgi:hypothetical protein